ncbi:MAG TPA: ABC transporter ATP-binding protein [Myxococcales bacterium]|jgi:peptide/nickel transport system ATP-binding protein
MSASLLEIRGLTLGLPGGGGRLAVDDVSLSLDRGGALGLVGESGCGKTMLALGILRLLPPGVRVVGGQVLLDGRDLVPLPEVELRAVRGRRIAMVFQEPLTSLNPVFTIGEQVAEAVRAHRRLGRAEAHARAVEALAAVGIADPERTARAYPHQLSGGMRQRAIVAMALSCEADVLLADEPTTALDATVQAQLLALLERLRAERKMALLLISHDLPVVSRVCDEVAVMYAGRVVERGPAAALLKDPRHPYTEALGKALPPAEPRPPGSPRPPLLAIPGRVPDEPLPGCSFAPRCPRASPECSSARPALRELAPGRSVACIHPLGCAAGAA